MKTIQNQALKIIVFEATYPSRYVKSRPVSDITSMQVIWVESILICFIE